MTDYSGPRGAQRGCAPRRLLTIPQDWGIKGVDSEGYEGIEGASQCAPTRLRRGICVRNALESLFNKEGTWVPGVDGHPGAHRNAPLRIRPLGVQRGAAPLRSITSPFTKGGTRGIGMRDEWGGRNVRHRGQAYWLCPPFALKWPRNQVTIASFALGGTQRPATKEDGPVHHRP